MEKKNAVEHLSFSVSTGEVFGLLGRNGAGKTTTIKMMLGLVTPDEGSVMWKHQKGLKGASFGYLPEERGLYPKAKVVDQLSYFARLEGMNKQSIKKSVDYWLDRFDIAMYRQDGRRSLEGKPTKSSVGCDIITYHIQNRGFRKRYGTCYGSCGWGINGWNQNHDGSNGRTRYHFPFFSPIVAYSKFVMGEISTLELLISGTVLVISIGLISYAASRIYVKGVMVYGEKFKWSQLSAMFKK